jgi:dihydrofolate reductase
MRQQTDSTSQPAIPPVAIIVAMTNDYVIGSGKGLPWHLPDDLQLFKHLTMGCTVIMGRKTYESIGHPLPGRQNIVLSRSLTDLSGVQICDNFMAGLTAATHLGRPLFVIGGEQLYRKALPIASEIHISWVKNKTPGNIHFPEFDLTKWTPCEEHDHPEFRYVRYRRKEIVC